MHYFNNTSEIHSSNYSEPLRRQSNSQGLSIFGLECHKSVPGVEHTTKAKKFVCSRTTESLNRIFTSSRLTYSVSSCSVLFKQSQL